MELFSKLADFILHIDRHLQLLASEYGLWLYGILFLIVFCETGLVVFPLLPGDSLLFAAGSLAAIPMSQLSPHWLFVIFTTAALLGDTVNYWIGRSLGPKVFHFEKSAFFNPEHLQKTRGFSKNTEARPSSSPVLFLLSAPLRHSWLASGPCPIRDLSCSALSGRCSGWGSSAMAGTFSDNCR